MITKPVKISKWPDKRLADGYEYVVVAANGHGIATMCKKGLAGLADASLIKAAINLKLLTEQLAREADNL